MAILGPVDLSGTYDDVGAGEPVGYGVDQWAREMEDELQYQMTSANMKRDEVLRGESFSKNGLTEVFTRKSRSESWTVRPANRSQNHTDIPGGALRFRLRAPADVHVFFTATISRLNKVDKYWSGGTQGGWEQYGGTKRNSEVRFKWLCNGLWEGSDEEPGRHYLQAQTLLASKSYRETSTPPEWSTAQRVPFVVDKVDVARSLFFAWKIRVVDGLTQPVGPGGGPVVNYLPSAPPEGEYGSRALSGATSSDKGRLQAGWHNIRHTMSWEEERLTLLEETASFDTRGSRRSADTLIFGNTELVVVANYGPTENISALLADNQSANALHQMVRARSIREVKPPKKQADE